MTGTVWAGTDSLNLFGGGSLVGKSVSFTFSYDPTQIAANGSYAIDNTHSYSSLTANNTSANTGTILEAVSISSGGITLGTFSDNASAGGSVASEAWARRGYNEFTLVSNGTDGSQFRFFVEQCCEVSFPYDVNAPAAVDANLSGDGGLYNQGQAVWTLNNGSGSEVFTVGNYGSVGYSFTDSSVDTAAPEPATWLLFGTGVSGIIFFARKRRLT